MSYDTFEASVASGSPYFLYLFSDGTTQTRFTSDASGATANVDGDGDEAFAASAISHSSQTVAGQVEKANFNIVFAASDSFAQGFLGGPKPAVTSVTIWRAHRGDSPTEYRVVAKGRVVGAKPTATRITLTCETIFSSMRRTGCRRRYQTLCPFILYGTDGCGLSRSDFETAGTVTAVNGLVLTIPEAASLDPGDLAGGIVNYGGLLAWILIHASDQVTIDASIPGLAAAVSGSSPAGVGVLVAPGCSLDSPRCKDRFDNLPNFGGYEFNPENNPFIVSIA